MLRSAVALLVALACSSPVVGHAQSGREGGEVAYVGELIDDRGAPISGVFPITFRLYETERGANALWSERHFLAVRDGAYQVTLGSAAPIPSALAGRQLVVAIELGTVGELLRQPITITFVPPAARREDVIAGLSLSYADVADRALVAVDAERADDCLLLDGRSLEDLDRYDEILGQIAQLRDQLDEVTGARLGSRTTTLERIGGAGGNPYSRSCPPGHVVTGVRGGAGSLLDSIELICSPLQ